MRGVSIRVAAFVGALGFVSAVPGSSLIQPSAQAQMGAAEGFHDYVKTLRAQAAAQGVSAATLDSVMGNLNFVPRAVELDRAQPGGAPGTVIPRFAPYREKHVDGARISRGRNKYLALRPLLQRVEQETGVPEEIMLAIYGHETNYGSYTGGFDLLNALASLAYDGRRRDLFAAEFIATLKLMDRGFPREKLKGSWAGATGYPQFLPSVYLRVAKDADGDGVADIWRSQADALASIANYFVDAGWRKGQAWGMAVSVPGTLNRASVGNRLTPPRCPRVFERFSRWMTVAEWRALGVVPMAAPALSDDTLAVLLEPDGPGRTGYLLTSNYEAILDYNCSNFYALSVGLLADGVAK